MKSIKTKMMVFFGVIIVIVCTGIGVSSYFNAKSALESNLQIILPEIAKQTSEHIIARVNGEIKALETVAERDDIKSLNLSLDEKLKILEGEGERLGAIRMGIADLDGNLLNTDGSTAEISHRAYFQTALTGKGVVSDPLVTPDKRFVVTYAAPIFNNGKVTAILLETRDGNALSEITNSIQIGENGTTFMINRAGVSIANPDPEKVIQEVSDIEAAETDASLTALAEIEKKMIAGETGMGKIAYQGEDKFIGYAPIVQTGWSVGITVTEHEALSVLDNLKVTAVSISVIFILLSLVAMYFMANTITKGIKLTSGHLKLLAAGDFSREISSRYLKQKDEIGEMMNSMKTMQESTGSMIGKIRGNTGDINEQAENLSSVTEEIADAAQNVTETITEIARGTNQQSEDLVMITGIMDRFNEKLTDIIGEIEDVGANSKEVGDLAADSSKEADLLNQSISKISESFKEFHRQTVSLGAEIHQIGEITDLINSIADQTNLLALNASIEAARAGEAGKGFAVVANEIGHLAEQSKVSSDKISKVVAGISAGTNAMVENSITMDQELMNQVGVIEHSLLSFQKIVEAVDEVIPKMEKIQASARDIEEDKNKVMGRIEGIASSAMEISASSEQISASSEEMSASVEEVAAAANVLQQATNQMMGEVERFKVK
ncbi:MAG TPA: methyl-accepting chemotaxis protein [Clostridiales bacterium]|nr:methyl-accepting chemotaxis protein [Clostridiales bacterium]